MKAKASLRRRGKTVLLTVLGLGAAAAIYGIIFGLPRPGGAERSEQSTSPGTARVAPGPTLSAASHASAVQEKWKSLEMQPAMAIGGRAGPNIDQLVAGAEGLSDEMRRSLAVRITNELRARTGTPEEYLAFADADRTTRWLTATDPQWATIDGWWQYAFHADPAHNDSRALLSPFLNDLFTSRGGRFRAVAIGDGGARLVPMSVRVPEEIAVRLQQALQKDGQSIRDYWLRATSSRPVTFRIAKRSLADVLHESGVAQVAVVMLVVETEDGNRFNWQTVYVWDPVQRDWFVEMMARKGWSGTTWY